MRNSYGGDWGPRYMGEISRHKQKKCLADNFLSICMERLRSMRLDFSRPDGAAQHPGEHTAQRAIAERQQSITRRFRKQRQQRVLCVERSDDPR